MEILYKTGDILHSDEEIILVEVSRSGLLRIDNPVHKAIVDKWGITNEGMDMYQGDIEAYRLDTNKVLILLCTRLDMLVPQHKEHTIYFLKEGLKKLAHHKPKSLSTYKFAADMPWDETAHVLEEMLPQTQITVYLY